LQFYFFVSNFQRFHREINANRVRVPFRKDISGLESCDNAAKTRGLAINSFVLDYFQLPALSHGTIAN
jgi:hypothetical protein